eukprot:scaffold1615_cov103-Isochrysis_galbana.AAC.10
MGERSWRGRRQGYLARQVSYDGTGGRAFEWGVASPLLERIVGLCAHPLGRGVACGCGASHLLEQVEVRFVAWPPARAASRSARAVKHSVHHGQQRAGDVGDVLGQVLAALAVVCHGALFEDLGLELYEGKGGEGKAR